MNLINSSTMSALGWTDNSNGGGTYTFAASEGRHQLIIDGNAGDTATLNGVNWTSMGTVNHNSNTYTVYNSDNGLAQVLVVAGVGFDETDVADVGLEDDAGNLARVGGKGGIDVLVRCLDHVADDARRVRG